MSNFALFLKVLGVLANPATLVTGGWRYLVNFFWRPVDISIWPPALQRTFNAFPWLRDNVAILTIAALYAWFQTLTGLVGAYTGVVARPFIRAIEEDEQNQIPTLSDLLNIATNNVPMKGPDGTLQDPRLLATSWGLHPNYFDALYAANGTLPSAGQLLDLLNRQDGGEIKGPAKYTKQYVEDALRESSLKDRYIADIMELRYQLLGASDYIRFAVRDVFDPVSRQKLTLDQDFPPGLAPKLVALGYSDQDAKDAWAAHWELPSPTQVYEMLHRGKLPDGVTVEDYLKSADYAPIWRQSLVDISYNPITRTDAKRIYKLRGDFDALVANFRNNGYNEEDAKALAEFTREDVSLEVRQERELLVGPVKTAALSMYKARRIGADQLRQTLSNLKYPGELIERFIADIDFVREQDRREDVANALKASYVKALRSRDDTVAILEKAGYTDTELAQLLEGWDILRESTELQPHQAAQRDLTKGEILQAFADDVYSEDQTRMAIVALGYDDAETSAIVGHAVLVRAKKALAEEVEVIHQETIAGGRSFDNASIALDQLGVPSTSKRLYLIKWGQERQKRIPDFPVALLEKLAAKNLLTTDAARFYLINQGYTEPQIGLLLALWDTNRADKQAALDARRQKGMTSNAPN
ncbi:MAG: hypothetical protein JW395_1560 [Nitrospira sp.]|nr:hypothetical protein [Nitrospira sp.]